MTNHKCAECRRGGATVHKKDRNNVWWWFHADCWDLAVAAMRRTDGPHVSTYDVLDWVRR